MPARPDAQAVARTLLPDLERLTARPQRLLLGLAGAPGVGKSALASALAEAFGAGDAARGTGGPGGACVLGMDGFHLPQAVLVRRGLDQVKGAPETFDAEGFVAVVRALRERVEVSAPVFDRVREEPVPDAVTVGPAHRLVLVEGNYLLLDGPWRPVRGLLDEVWHLRLPDSVRVPGLVARHVAHGRSRAEAKEWVHRSDEANARLVAAAAHRADAVVDLMTGRLVSRRSRGSVR